MRNRNERSDETPRSTSAWFGRHKEQARARGEQTSVAWYLREMTKPWSGDGV